MANKITNEDILRINEIYYKTHTYAEAARQTGFAASTVKKYVIPGWKPVEATNVVRVDLSVIPDHKEAAKAFKGVDNYGTLCVLTECEQQKMIKLWGELAL